MEDELSKQISSTIEILDKYISDSNSFPASKDLGEGMAAVSNSAQKAKASFDQIIDTITKLRQKENL